MNDYQQVRIDLTPCSEDATDLLAAFLADEGYESFVPDEKGLTAYIPAPLFSNDRLHAVLDSFPMDVAFSCDDIFVEGRDWNSEWERNYFRPIVVADRVAIYSSFHTDIPAAEHRIVIDPKMAFGTGHHATTSQVIENMLDLNLESRSVIDMGTGTGILAILASMLGASPVTGIEIDGFAYANAVENARLNNQPDITLINGDATALKDCEPADIFIANINRNIITADIAAYSDRLKPGGAMLLSGFYTDDIPLVLKAAEPYGLAYTSNTERDRWVCLRLTKQA